MSVLSHHLVTQLALLCICLVSEPIAQPSPLGLQTLTIVPIWCYPQVCGWAHPFPHLILVHCLASGDYASGVQQRDWSYASALDAQPRLGGLHGSGAGGVTVE